MAQILLDKCFVFQEMYKATLHKISKDLKAVRYAAAWMDYQLASFGFQNKEYSPSFYRKGIVNRIENRIFLDFGTNFEKERK